MRPKQGDERPLASAGEVRDLMSRHGITPEKRFGQNFLIDSSVVKKTVDALGPLERKTVYEVGPGMGTLTRALAEAGAKVVAVEMDRRFRPVLEETLADLKTTSPHGLSKAEVVWGDALLFDWNSASPGSLFAANLPYNIATPLLTQLLVSGRFQRLVVMVQKEVAGRLVAKPGSKNYGLLSLRVEHHAKAKKLFDIPPGAFFPAPKVTSSVVLLEATNTPDNPALFRLIEAAFGQRRKTLKNALVAAGYPADRVLEGLEALSLSPSLRGEALSLAQFKSLLARLA